MLYISTDQLETEIFLKSNITGNSIKKYEILRDKSDKNEKDLYTENHKPLLREIKEDLNKQRYIMFMDWTDEYVKLSILPKSKFQQAFL